MGKLQLTQLLNYQNYQNAIKVKTSTLSWTPFSTLSLVSIIGIKKFHISTSTLAIILKIQIKKNFFSFLFSLTFLAAKQYNKYPHWAHQLWLPSRTLTLLSPWLLHKQDQSSMQSSESFSSTSALNLSTFLTGTTTWILNTMMSYTVGEMSNRRMMVRHKDLKEIVEAIKEYFDKEAAVGDQVFEMLKVGWAQLDRSFRQLKIFHFPLEKTCLVTEKM